ncbi:UNVERIFIED_CONTAM: hypothetical protein K2H54_064824 [Gekko kuhli]
MSMSSLHRVLKTNTHNPLRIRSISEGNQKLKKAGSDLGLLRLHNQFKVHLIECLGPRFTLMHSKGWLWRTLLLLSLTPNQGEREEQSSHTENETKNSYPCRAQA